MSYATLAQLSDRFGAQVLIAITDRGPVPTGAIDADVVVRALADTAAVIDGYVGVRYRLPLDPVPELVTDIALSIALYKLHVFVPDPKVKDDYEQALRTLREISGGSVRLNAAGIEAPTSGAQDVQYIDRDRPLSPETMTGFI